MTKGQGVDLLKVNFIRRESKKEKAFSLDIEMKDEQEIERKSKN